MLQPRLRALRWAAITKQSPGLKVGYPGQHLASVITGVEGRRSGARGLDLADSSEVKACSRLDQLDECKVKECKSKVARHETECPACGSPNIKRNNDSKWLFSVTSELELAELVSRPRIVFLLADYPGFGEGDFTALRFQAFEIWPGSARGHRFAELMDDYYRKIFLPKTRASATARVAPKNFWPESYQFYLCNPIRTMHATVRDANSSPVVTLDALVEPTADRANIDPHPMPSRLLSDGELKDLIKAAPNDVLIPAINGCTIEHFRSMSPSEQRAALPEIPEPLRALLPLRD